MNEPIFRRALPDDWLSIRSLLAANKLPLEGARDHLGSFMIVHDETGLIACGGLELYGSTALLRSVVVAESHRGSRLGQELVMKLFSLALSEKVDTLVLLTDSAESYFRRLGFKTADRATLPQAVKASAEFQGACRASATAMLLNLSLN